MLECRPYAAAVGAVTWRRSVKQKYLVLSQRERSGAGCSINPVQLIMCVVLLVLRRVW